MQRHVGGSRRHVGLVAGGGAGGGVGGGAGEGVGGGAGGRAGGGVGGASYDAVQGLQTQNHLFKTKENIIFLK